MFHENRFSRYLTEENYVFLGERMAELLLEDKPAEAAAVEYCPFCKGKIKKNGRCKDGLQRYKCLACNHTFNESRSKEIITYHSHLPKEMWHKFIVEFFRHAYKGNNAVHVLKEINKNTSTIMCHKVIKQVYLHMDYLNDLIDELTKEKREKIERKEREDHERWKAKHSNN